MHGLGTYYISHHSKVSSLIEWKNVFINTGLICQLRKTPCESGIFLQVAVYKWMYNVSQIANIGGSRKQGAEVILAPLMLTLCDSPLECVLLILTNFGSANLKYSIIHLINGIVSITIDLKL